MTAIDVIAAGLAVRNVQFLDNPIVGGGGCGGGRRRRQDGDDQRRAARRFFARVEPILKKLTRNVFYAGEKPGLAQVCKCVNAALAITGSDHCLRGDGDGR